MLMRCLLLAADSNATFLQETQLYFFIRKMHDVFMTFQENITQSDGFVRTFLLKCLFRLTENVNLVILIQEVSVLVLRMRSCSTMPVGPTCVSFQHSNKQYKAIHK